MTGFSINADNSFITVIDDIEPTALMIDYHVAGLVSYTLKFHFLILQDHSVRVIVTAVTMGCHKVIMIETAMIAIEYPISVQGIEGNAHCIWALMKHVYMTSERFACYPIILIDPCEFRCIGIP